MDFLPLNFKLLTNPVNWGIVLLTVLIGSFALHALKPTSANQE